MPLAIKRPRCTTRRRHTWAQTTCPDTIVCRHPSSTVGMPCKKQYPLYRGCLVMVRLTRTHFTVKHIAQSCMRHRCFRSVPWPLTRRHADAWIRLVEPATDVSSSDHLAISPRSNSIISVQSLGGGAASVLGSQREHQGLTIPLRRHTGLGQRIFPGAHRVGRRLGSNTPAGWALITHGSCTPPSADRPNSITTCPSIPRTNAACG